MAMNLKEIEKLIKESIPDALVEIQDLAGDGNHYSATISSSEFIGKSKIEKIRNDAIFNIGKSGEVAANEIIKIVNEEKHDQNT